MPRIKCWQVDAFTDRPFAGNPAAVCWLEQEADAAWMQQVAAEMNLSETAFVRPLGEGHELRWFTPAVEVDLCGHATLAAAHALWQSGMAPKGALRFHTRSGVLACTQVGDFIELDFPATPAAAMAPPATLVEALGVEPVFTGSSKFYLLVALASAAAVRSLRPDFRKLLDVPTLGVIATAASDDPKFDFISRFFAPALGVNEDPVCGSAQARWRPRDARRAGGDGLAGRTGLNGPRRLLATCSFAP